MSSYTEEGDGARAAVRAGAERGCEADEAAARQRCGEARRGGERGGGGCGSGHEGSEGGDGRWGGVRLSELERVGEMEKKEGRIERKPSRD